MATIINVRDFGAKGDGCTLDTEAIQKAIDACEKGDTLLLGGKGFFLCGTLRLKGDMTLFIEQGTELVGSRNLDHYYANEFYHNEMVKTISLIYALDCDNIEICLPDGAPISKIEATKSYGADVCLVEGVYDDAYKKALELRDECGYTFIHPFNDEDVIAGQGTIALEIADQVPDLDAIIVPIGGGGLISGVAYTIKQINPHVKVYGVQAAGAPSMYKSLKNGQIEELPSVSTIADGIAVKKPGDLTYELCSKYVDEVVTVNDDEISAAILTLMEQQKMVTEGAGAIAVAAAMFGKLDIKGKKVVCVLSGGNIDVTILSRVIKRGLLMSGRTCQLMIELADKPGQLKNVSRIIADLGGNVISVHHERANEGSDVTGCYLRIMLETRNYEHIDAIKKALCDFGFKLL